MITTSNTSTCGGETSKLESGVQVLLTTTMSLFCLVSVFSNILVIITIFATRKLRTITSGFLLNLSLSDLCCSLVLMPLVIEGIAQNGWIHSQLSCRISGFLVQILLHSSIYTVTATAFDRYLAILHCLKYSSWSHHKYIGSIISVVWFLAVIVSLPSLFGLWGDIRYQNHTFMCFPCFPTSVPYGIFYLLITCVFPFLTMFVCYSVIIHVARKHARRIGDINAHLNRNNSANSRNKVAMDGLIAFACLDPVRQLSMFGIPHGRLFNGTGADIEAVSLHSVRSYSGRIDKKLQRETKAVLRLIGLVLIFFVCWTPTSIATFISTTGNCNGVPRYLWTASVWCIALHLTLNPFLYAIFSAGFRAATTKLLHMQKDQVRIAGHLDRFQSQDLRSFGVSVKRCSSAPVLRKNVLSITPVEDSFQEQSMDTSNDRRRSSSTTKPSNSMSDTKFLKVPEQSCILSSLPNYVRRTSYNKRPVQHLERISSVSSFENSETFSNAKVTVKIKLELAK